MHLKKFLIPLLSVSLLLTPVYSVCAEEQGTLSPSSENSDSVFGGTSTSAEPVTDEELQALLNQIQGQLPVDNGNWSVFVSDLINETEGCINEQSMQAASLIKLYIMGPSMRIMNRSQNSTAKIP